MISSLMLRKPYFGMLSAFSPPIVFQSHRNSWTVSRPAYNESSSSIRLYATAHGSGSHTPYVPPPAGWRQEWWLCPHCTISLKWRITCNILISRQILRELFLLSPLVLLILPYPSFNAVDSRKSYAIIDTSRIYASPFMSLSGLIRFTRT